MKLTVKEIAKITEALADRRDNLEWDIRQYDDNGELIRDDNGVIVPNKKADRYPEYIALGKLIEKLESAEV